MKPASEMRSGMVIRLGDIELEVRSTPAPIHLDDSSLFKPAVLENGMEVRVPQFVKQGDVIRIEVSSGRHLERVR